MKKIIMLMMAVLMVFSMTACSGEKTESTNGDEGTV